MKRVKKAQFYLIAALIIVFVIIGFFSLSNYAKKQKTDVRIYNVAEELKIETGNVYDYGVYNQKNLSLLIDNWTTQYYDYSRVSGNLDDWIFIYGNQNDITAVTFTKEAAGNIGVVVGTERVNVPIERSGKKIKKLPSGNNLNLEFNNISYGFNLKTGENFYFVIKSKGSVAKG